MCEVSKPGVSGLGGTGIYLKAEEVPKGGQKVSQSG